MNKYDNNSTTENGNLNLTPPPGKELSPESFLEIALGLPLFYVPVVMRVFRTYSPCLEEGGA